MDANVLHNITYGMYIVASFKDAAINAQIVNALIQVSSHPAKIAVSINKKNLTYEFITNSRYFTVSTLDEATPLNFIGKFGFKSGRAEDKLEGVEYKKLVSGCPVMLDNSICYFEARVLDEFDCGTHALFIGEETESEVIKVGRPMSYDYYHNVKRGTTPQSAPTFIKEEIPIEGNKNMQKYRCSVCNYIYDSAVGDPDNGVAPGISFEQLPDKWVCPVCGAEKKDFVVE